MEYEFIVICKLGRTHVIADALSKLPNNSKPLGVSNQTVDASLFYVEPIWMQDVKTYLETDARNSELSSKIEVRKKGKTFHSKRGNYVQSGPRQHNV